MNVIFDPVDLQRHATEAANSSAYVLVKLAPPFLTDIAASAFCGADEVIVEIVEC